jgi:hypothetical protein
MEAVLPYDRPRSSRSGVRTTAARKNHDGCRPRIGRAKRVLARLLIPSPPRWQLHPVFEGCSTGASLAQPSPSGKYDAPCDGDTNVLYPYEIPNVSIVGMMKKRRRPYVPNGYVRSGGRQAPNMPETSQIFYLRPRGVSFSCIPFIKGASLAVRNLACWSVRQLRQSPLDGVFASAISQLHRRNCPPYDILNRRSTDLQCISRMEGTLHGFFSPLELSKAICTAC